MFVAMRKLIQKKFYKTAEEAQAKIDVFYAMNRLTTAEYRELSELITEVYKEAVVTIQ